MKVGALIYRFITSPFGVLLVFLLYAVVGAAVFTTIEGSLIYIYNGTSTEEQTKMEMWTFDAAFVYCGTLLTTIGYGHLTPQTGQGKVLTIFYSLIGIPLCFVTLIDLGDLLHRAVKFLLSFLCRLCSAGISRRSKGDSEAAVLPLATDASEMAHAATRADDPKNNLSTGPAVIEAENVDNDQTGLGRAGARKINEPSCNVFLVMTVTLLCFIIYVLIGAAVAVSWETEWNFGDAVYFIVISLTTTGFGDLIPQHPHHAIFSSFYIFVGLIIASTNVHAGISVGRVIKEKIEGKVA